MSAFVVDTATMDRAVSAICARGRYGQILSQFNGVFVDTADAPTTIGRRLFTLNIEAVMQRYPDCENDPTELPGVEGCASYPETYRFSGRLAKPFARIPSLVDGYKALRCLIYQCSEGNVVRSDLYRELESAAGEIAGEIVQMLPDYERAAW